MLPGWSRVAMRGPNPLPSPLHPRLLPFPRPYCHTHPSTHPVTPQPTLAHPSPSALLPLPLQVCEVFDDMLASGLPPSIVSYNTLLSAYASTGAWSEALDTLCRVLAAQLEGVSPNTTTCEFAGGLAPEGGWVWAWGSGHGLGGRGGRPEGMFLGLWHGGGGVCGWVPGVVGGWGCTRSCWCRVLSQQPAAPEERQGCTRHRLARSEPHHDLPTPFLPFSGQSLAADAMKMPQRTHPHCTVRPPHPHPPLPSPCSQHCAGRHGQGCGLRAAPQVPLPRLPRPPGVFMDGDGCGWGWGRGGCCLRRWSSRSAGQQPGNRSTRGGPWEGGNGREKRGQACWLCPPVICFSGLRPSSSPTLAHPPPSPTLCLLRRSTSRCRAGAAARRT